MYVVMEMVIHYMQSMTPHETAVNVSWGKQRTSELDDE